MKYLTVVQSAPAGLPGLTSFQTKVTNVLFALFPNTFYYFIRDKQNSNTQNVGKYFTYFAGACCCLSPAASRLRQASDYSHKNSMNKTSLTTLKSINQRFDTSGGVWCFPGTFIHNVWFLWLASSYVCESVWFCWPQNVATYLERTERKRSIS